MKDKYRIIKCEETGEYLAQMEIEYIDDKYWYDYEVKRVKIWNNLCGWTDSKLEATEAILDKKAELFKIRSRIIAERHPTIVEEM